MPSVWPRRLWPRHKQSAKRPTPRQSRKPMPRQLPPPDKRTAEATEAALRLTPRDRQLIQVALTSLGFDTRGNDGALGPRSRDMIAGWQKARNYSVTGFLTRAQHQELLREGAPAIAKYSDEQKKIEDEKKKSDEEARAKVAAAAPPPATVPAGGDIIVGWGHCTSHDTRRDHALDRDCTVRLLAGSDSNNGPSDWRAGVRNHHRQPHGHNGGLSTFPETGIPVRSMVASDTETRRYWLARFQVRCQDRKSRATAFIRAEQESPKGPNESSCTIELDRAG